MSSEIGQRKADHIALCAEGDVGFREKTTLLEEVELLHDAVGELAWDDVDISVKLFGKTLRAPIIVAAMTGGTEEARTINRQLAAIAERRGLGFGLGSQRPMLRDASALGSYAVRDVAPTALLLGNLGGVQARALSTKRARELCDAVGADALCVHLNPAMELVQPGGDRDFSGILATLERFTADLGRPVVAKETGCGISTNAALKLLRHGVRHVDVSGAGGTSWVAVETERATPAAKALGQLLREWGVPTAASIAYVRRAKPKFSTIIATGGIKTGLDAARALSLGADAVGIARPVLQALKREGTEGAERYLEGVEQAIRAAVLLVGAKSLKQLRKAPKVLGPKLARWLDV